MTTRRLLLATGACLALAAASLLIADEPVYDAWAWLVWGRELAAGGLDATSGPSWKPLPPALTAPLSLAGAGAPALWLVLVRGSWLLSFVLAAELSWMLTVGRGRAARIAGAAFAAAGVALLADAVTPWARQAAGGMSEPLLVALVFGAVRAALRGQVAIALGAGALAALIRPEAWPLLVLYALWCARGGDGRVRALAVTVVVGVPALWLGPELLGAGGGGAARARTQTSNPAEVLWRAAVLPLAVAWPLALAALRDRAARVLAIGALGWIALVAGMTLVGFAGLPRFVAPAGALVCVLGGAGLAALLHGGRAALGSGRRLASRAAVALLLATIALSAYDLPARATDLVRGWSSARRIDGEHDRLRALAGAVGGRRLLACGRLATSDVLVRTALAWQLHVPLSQVVSFGRPPRLSGAFVVGPQAAPGLRAAIGRSATAVARNGEWRVYSIDCPATASASPARSAGVSGTTR